MMPENASWKYRMMDRPWQRMERDCFPDDLNWKKAELNLVTEVMVNKLYLLMEMND